ncbi:putative quinol monooxygenase [Phenylobacterium sp.]|uniref:putative quinol monooxygenase n=1 Tax=Phenylobacterium sp. TaxID=1871053 RepID=UPI002FC9D899
MILVTGAVDAKPETFDELRQLCVDHSVRSRAEPGCRSHNVHVDCEAPLRLVFVERWADLEALKTHFARADAIGFVKAARRLATGGTRMEILDTTPATL